MKLISFDLVGDLFYPQQSHVDRTTVNAEESGERNRCHESVGPSECFTPS